MCFKVINIKKREKCHIHLLLGSEIRAKKLEIEKIDFINFWIKTIKFIPFLKLEYF